MDLLNTINCLINHKNITSSWVDIFTHMELIENGKLIMYDIKGENCTAESILKYFKFSIKDLIDNKRCIINKGSCEEYYYEYCKCVLDNNDTPKISTGLSKFSKEFADQYNIFDIKSCITFLQVIGIGGVEDTINKSLFNAFKANPNIIFGNVKIKYSNNPKWKNSLLYLEECRQRIYNNYNSGAEQNSYMKGKELRKIRGAFIIISGKYNNNHYIMYDYKIDGKWNRFGFPGGTAEPEENYSTTVRREIREELGQNTLNNVIEEIKPIMGNSVYWEVSKSRGMITYYENKFFIVTKYNNNKFSYNSNPDINDPEEINMVWLELETVLHNIKLKRECLYLKNYTENIMDYLNNKKSHILYEMGDSDIEKIKKPS